MCARWRWTALFWCDVVGRGRVPFSRRCAGLASGADPVKRHRVRYRVLEFDLAGTGSTMGVAIRGTRPLVGRKFALEVGATLAAPEQQIGASFFASPESRLLYSWRVGRWRPFVGGGGGAAVIRSSLRGADWRLTLTGGGGVRVDLNERMYVVGEMRLRGISRSSHRPRQNGWAGSSGTCGAGGAGVTVLATDEHREGRVSVPLYLGRAASTSDDGGPMF